MTIIRIIVAAIIFWTCASISWAAAAKAPSAEASSRFTFHQGHWWYWLPSKRWAVYLDGQWLVPPAQRPSPDEHAIASRAAASQKAEPASFANSDADLPATGNAEASMVDKRSDKNPTIAELDSEVRQMKRSLERLERQVRQQGETQAALVRGQKAVTSKLRKQSEDAAKHAEKVRKNRVGID